MDILKLSKQERSQYEKDMELLSLEASLEETYHVRLRGAEHKGKIEGKAEGLAEGITKGLAEGEYKKAIKVAKTLKADGLSIEQIAKYTQLSIAEIEQLQA